MRSPIVVFTIAAAVAIGPALVSGLPASPGGPGADLAVPASEVSKHEPSDGRIPSIHRRQDLVGALGGIGDVNKATGPGDQGDDSESHHNTSSHEEAEPNFGEGRDRHGQPTGESTHGRAHDGTDGNFPARNQGTGGRGTGPQGSGPGSTQNPGPGPAQNPGPGPAQTPGSGSPQNSGGA